MYGKGQGHDRLFINPLAMVTVTTLMVMSFKGQGHDRLFINPMAMVTVITQIDSRL